MTTSNRPTSWFRRWTLWAVIVSILLAAPFGASPAGAESPPGYGFQWGPGGDPAAMRSPLNDLRVLDAADLAVDESGISTRLFGEPGRLVFVAGDDRPQGDTLFSTGKANDLLAAAGVTSLTLTIGYDPDVVEAPPIAEAIAADLRANIGAAVTVVAGDGDFLVTKDTAEPMVQPGALTLEESCTPDAFRPEAWTVVECVTYIVNRGDAPVSNIGLAIGAFKGIAPDVFWMWGTTNGQLWSVPQGTLFFDGGESVLEPGQSAESHLIMLLNVPEGTFELELKLNVGKQTVATAPLYFAATKNAPAPPTDLVVTTQLVTGRLSGGKEAPTAIYETRIMNRGSRTVDDLTLTERFDPTLLAADPPPDNREGDLGLATWSLASFGRDSLAPGEWLTLQTTYGLAEGADCGQVNAGTVVEAAFGGEKERYGTHAGGVSLGECGGGALPTGLGRGGDGPGGSKGDVIWAAACLAVGGAALVRLATAMRRRARR